jgi:aspartyl protease family protein
MLKNFVMLGILVGAFASLPIFYELNPGAVERWYAAVMADDVAPAQTVDQPARTAAVAVTQMAPAGESQPMLGRKVLVRSDSTGHFVAQFRLNGRALNALIDTGATVIAINRTTARQIGVSIANADFRYEVRTANGMAKAAVATIDRVQVGRISLDNVQAMVLDDAALEGALIGMSFLGRLSKFQVQDGALVMQQ